MDKTLNRFLNILGYVKRYNERNGIDSFGFQSNTSTNVLVRGIEWEADDFDDIKNIPSEMLISIPSDIEPDDFESYIEDELSNQSGFTHLGWSDHEVISLVENNYFIYFNHSENKWAYASNWEAESIQVYMSFECAVTLVNELNSGYFDIDKPAAGAYI